MANTILIRLLTNLGMATATDPKEIVDALTPLCWSKVRADQIKKELGK